MNLHFSLKRESRGLERHAYIILDGSKCPFQRLLPKDQSFYNVYLKPLQKSPLSIFAASTLSYTLTPFSAPAFGSPITSSRSPRSRRAFSAFRTMRKIHELKKPTAMYASTMPCPREYHGLSSARYCRRRITYRSSAERMEECPAYHVRGDSSV